MATAPKIKPLNKIFAGKPVKFVRATWLNYPVWQTNETYQGWEVPKNAQQVSVLRRKGGKRYAVQYWVNDGKRNRLGSVKTLGNFKTDKAAIKFVKEMLK